MSVLYDDYLAEHKQNVQKARIWMDDHLQFVRDIDPFWNTNVDNHDNSKTDIEEYTAYDAYFYGGNRSARVLENFNRAWLHHIHHNPHHWQYWVLLEDDPQSGERLKALEMPVWYVTEMIADWWSFSWKSGDPYSVFKWYDDHKSTMILHPKTRKLVENVLAQIKHCLDTRPIAEKTDPSMEN